MIFGTQKFIRMFSPSLRQTPLSGLEWSFLLNERGIPEDGDVPYNYEQEMTQISNIEQEDDERSRATNEAESMR